MRFSSITGQDSIRENLVRSVKEERVSHAQIFAGPEGSGKLALAMAFAQYISCQDRGAEDSCGVCPSCVKYEKLIHPDLHFVFPVIRKGSADPVSTLFMDKWRELVLGSPYFNLTMWLSHIGVGNEQGLIYASEAAEIIKKLSLKTYESDYKSMIIWLPEKMHPATANKLLKMIEEPPDNTLFLLVSEEPDMVLPTIMSRCQFVRIPGIGVKPLSEAIAGKFNIDPEKAKSIARLSHGNLLRAEGLINEDELRALNLRNFKELMRLSWQKDIVNLAEWADNLASSGREAQKRFLTFSLGQLRENFMQNLGQDANNLVYLDGDEQEFAGKFSRYIHKGNIELLSSEFTKAHTHISSNGNAKIIFMDLALKVTVFIRKQI